MPFNPLIGQFDEAPEPHPFWVILETILYYLVQAAVALLALAMLVSGIVTAYKMLSYRKQGASYQAGEDEKTFVIPERAKKERRKLRDFFPYPENKTRRIFRKKIQRHRKMGVPITQSDTPIQMVARIDKEDISALALEYEKVRYRPE